MLEATDPQDHRSGLIQMLRPDGILAEPGCVLPDTATLLRMLREMVRVRRIDERMLGKQRQGQVGFYGSITGQEAVPIAAALAAEPGDWVFPALREAAIMLVRGFPLRTWLAQVYGNEADLLKGRQMPSHMSGRAVHQVSWSSCIGTQLPHAVGAAMAAKRKGDRMVALAFCGDGATSEPDFHAAMNFAGVYRAPVVIVCQNNQWSISVPTSRQTASETIAAKAQAYGLPGLRVDGNDVIATHRVLCEALDRARQGLGPSFVECVTYRLGAHSSSDDPTRYRSDEEVERWKQRDPILRLRLLLECRGSFGSEAQRALEHELHTELEGALSEVQALPTPARQTMFEDVFATLPWHLSEQATESERTTWQTQRATTSS